MVNVPTTFGIRVTEHEEVMLGLTPGVRLHAGEGEKVPDPAGLTVRETDPRGAVPAPPALSETDTEHDVTPPITTLLGLHTMAVLVDRGATNGEKAGGVGASEGATPLTPK